MPFSRRQMIGASAVALAGLSSMPSGQGHQAKHRKPGIQLYTVRGSMGESPAATLEALAAMGYAEVEFAGHGELSAEEVRALLADTGLDAPSAHLDPLELRREPVPLLDFAAAVGHRHVVIAWLPEDERQTLDQYRAWAEVLNRVGEACRSRGLRMAYHNHDFEFVPIDGTVPYDILMEFTDPELVDFELDFYWVAKAGRDVVEVLSQAPRRFTLAHIKDMGADGNIVDVGTGSIDFAGILAHPAAASLRHLFVEHDHSPDPFRTAAVSRRALSRVLAAL